MRLTTLAGFRSGWPFGTGVCFTLASIMARSAASYSSVKASGLNVDALRWISSLASES
jgi:hypothetical protein